jgi:chemotaxis signal transduction protein
VGSRIQLAGDDILSPVGRFSPTLTTYLQGCVPHEEHLLLLLDAEAIAQSLVTKIS